MNKYLQQILRNNACGDVRLRSYSGRAMYGKSCVAITGDVSDLKKTLKDSIRAAVDEYVNTVRDAAEELEDIEDPIDVEEAEDKFCKFMDVVFEYSEDSMGLGAVYYWKNIPYVNGPGDD